MSCWVLCSAWRTSASRGNQERPVMRMTDHHLGLAAAAPIGDLARGEPVTFNERRELRTIIGVDMHMEVDSGIKEIVAHVAVRRTFLDGFAEDQRPARRLEQPL